MMKWVIDAILLLLFAGAVFYFWNGGGVQFLQVNRQVSGINSGTLNIPVTENKNMDEKGFSLESSAFGYGGNIPSKYTCDGANINPELLIKNVPEGTKTLAVIMEDPDVPKNLRADGLWVHWVHFNIPPETTKVPEGQEPGGIAGKGTGNNLKYYGPCPPDKEHRYFFKLYSLDAILWLPEGSVKKELESAMEGHVLAETVLMGRYNRNK